MEYIKGKHCGTLETTAFSAGLQAYREVAVDLGTGDGRYVRQLARQHLQTLVIGLDACRENLIEVSRKSPPNALFLIANAAQLPPELNGVADTITINFPWGSLLEGLLEPGTGVIEGLRRLAKPGAGLEIRLNQSAMQTTGHTLTQGGLKVRQSLREAGFAVQPLQPLQAQELRACPTTWARRLAYGREPFGLYLRAICPGNILPVTEEVQLATL